MLEYKIRYKIGDSAVQDAWVQPQGTVFLNTRGFATDGHVDFYWHDWPDALMEGNEPKDLLIRFAGMWRTGKN